MERRKKRKTVAVECHDLYQLMIAECRYGYTRNNHLMPWGAFNHCYFYLPKLAKADPDCAKHTAKQLAEEAIEQLRLDSFGDVRKQFSVLQEGIADAPAELRSKWQPGIYGFSVEIEFEAKNGVSFSVPRATGDPLTYVSLKSTDSPGKIVVELLDFDADPHDFFFRVYCPTPGKPGWYQSLNRSGNQPVLVEEGQKMLFTIERSERTLNVHDYEDFIEYCMSLSKDSRPYNYGDYEEFLAKHPKPVLDE